MRFKTKAALVLLAIVLGYVTTYLAARDSLAYVVRDPSLACVFSDSTRLLRPSRTAVWSHDERLNFSYAFVAMQPWDKLRCVVSEVLFKPLSWAERKAFGHWVKFAPD